MFPVNKIIKFCAYYVLPAMLSLLLLNLLILGVSTNVLIEGAVVLVLEIIFLLITRSNVNYEKNSENDEAELKDYLYQLGYTKELSNVDFEIVVDSAGETFAPEYVKVGGNQYALSYSGYRKNEVSSRYQFYITNDGGGAYLMIRDLLWEMYRVFSR